MKKEEEVDKRFEDTRMEALDKEQLGDLIIDINVKLERHIKQLSKEMKIIYNLQQKKEKAQVRLAELGFYVGREESVKQVGQK